MADFTSREPPPRLTLAQLREKVGEMSPMEPAKAFASPDEALAISAGSLVELTGSSPNEWLMRFFARHPQTAIAWLEPKLTLYPTAVRQRGVDLSRILFIENEKELLWCLNQVVRSPLFSFIVTSGAILPRTRTDAFLRRLQISVERSGSCLFFVSERATVSFGIQYRIETSAGGASKILKRKRG